MGTHMAVPVLSFLTSSQATPACSTDLAGYFSFQKPLTSVYISASSQKPLPQRITCCFQPSLHAPCWFLVVFVTALRGIFMSMGLFAVALLWLSPTHYRPHLSRNNIYLSSWCWQRAEQCAAPRRCSVNISGMIQPQCLSLWHDEV